MDTDIGNIVNSYIESDDDTKRLISEEYEALTLEVKTQVAQEARDKLAYSIKETNYHSAWVLIQSPFISLDQEKGKIFTLLVEQAIEKKEEKLLRCIFAGEEIGIDESYICIVKHVVGNRESYLIDKNVMMSGLLNALSDVDISDLMIILEEQFDIEKAYDIKSSSSATVMHMAARYGKLNYAKTLLSEKPGLLDMTKNNGLTVLHIACVRGHKAIAEWLVAQKPTLLDMKTSDGVTALHSACARGHKAIAEWLVEKKPELLDMSLNDGSTVLHYAALNGHKEVVEWLVEKKPELLDMSLNDGLTVLHSAALKGHKEVAEWLVEKKPDLLDMKDNQGFTALHLAVQEGHKEVAEWLVAQKSDLLDMTTNDGATALHLAANEGHKEVAEWLVEKKPDLLGMKDSTGATALHLAAHQGHKEVAEWLVAQKPTLLDMKDNNGNTVLHAAAQAGYKEVAEWFVAQKPDLLDMTNNNGETVLHLAAHQGHKEVAEWLVVQKPALLDMTNNQGATVLHLAADEGHKEVAEWLVEKKPDLLDMTMNDGTTALHRAAYEGHKEVVECLLAHGADAAIADHSRITPLMQAVKKNDTELIKVFIEHRCTVPVSYIVDYFLPKKKGTVQVKEMIKSKPSLLQERYESKTLLAHLLDRKKHNLINRFIAEAIKVMTALDMKSFITYLSSGEDFNIKIASKLVKNHLNMYVKQALQMDHMEAIANIKWEDLSLDAEEKQKLMTEIIKHVASHKINDVYRQVLVKFSGNRLLNYWSAGEVDAFIVMSQDDESFEWACQVINQVDRRFFEKLKEKIDSVEYRDPKKLIRLIKIFVQYDMELAKELFMAMRKRGIILDSDDIDFLEDTGVLKAAFEEKGSKYWEETMTFCHANNRIDHIQEEMDFAMQAVHIQKHTLEGYKGAGLKTYWDKIWKLWTCSFTEEDISTLKNIDRIWSLNPDSQGLNTLIAIAGGDEMADHTSIGSFVTKYPQWLAPAIFICRSDVSQSGVDTADHYQSRQFIHHSILEAAVRKDLSGIREQSEEGWIGKMKMVLSNALMNWKSGEKYESQTSFNEIVLKCTFMPTPSRKIKKKYADVDRIVGDPVNFKRAIEQLCADYSDEASSYCVEVQRRSDSSEIELELRMSAHTLTLLQEKILCLDEKFTKYMVSSHALVEENILQKQLACNDVKEYARSLKRGAFWLGTAAECSEAFFNAYKKAVAADKRRLLQVMPLQLLRVGAETINNTVTCFVNTLFNMLKDRTLDRHMMMAYFEKLVSSMACVGCTNIGCDTKVKGALVGQYIKHFCLKSWQEHQSIAHCWPDEFRVKEWNDMVKAYVEVELRKPGISEESKAYCWHQYMALGGRDLPFSRELWYSISDISGVYAREEHRLYLDKEFIKLVEECEDDDALNRLLEYRYEKCRAEMTVFIKAALMSIRINDFILTKAAERRHTVFANHIAVIEWPEHWQKDSRLRQVVREYKHIPSLERRLRDLHPDQHQDKVVSGLTEVTMFSEKRSYALMSEEVRQTIKSTTVELRGYIDRLIPRSSMGIRAELCYRVWEVATLLGSGQTVRNRIVHGYVMHAFDTGLSQPLQRAIDEIQEFADHDVVPHNMVSYDIDELPEIDDMSQFEGKDKGLRFILIYLNEYLKKNDSTKTEEEEYIRSLRNDLSHTDNPGKVWDDALAARGFDTIAQDVMALWQHVKEHAHGCASGGRLR